MKLKKMRHFPLIFKQHEARNVAKFTTMYLFGHNQDHAQNAMDLIEMDFVCLEESSIILWLPIYQLCMYIHT